MRSPPVSRFCDSLLKGDWLKAEAQFGELGLNDQQAQQVKFLIARQKFLELLEAKDTSGALTCLRTEIAPLQRHKDELTRLSAFVICKNPDELRSKANWDGTHGQSRKHLIHDISAHVHSNQLLPKERLKTLISQGLELQKSKCLYHNSPDNQYSLLEDHSCDRY